MTTSEQIVQEMIDRLRKLQGSGEWVPVGRKINTGEGLAGGGPLTEDLTITPTVEMRETVKATKQLLARELPDKTQVQEMITSRLPKAAPRVYYRDFTVQDAPAETVAAPPLRLPDGAVLVSVEVTVMSPGAKAVQVTAGGKQVSVDGRAEYKKIEVGTPVTGPVQVIVDPTDAAGIVVSLRFEEPAK